MQTSVSEVECNALISLYNGTTGASWTDSTNWLFSDDVCSWYGVTCKTGTVSELILNNNNLNGSIPVEIGDLINLEFLGMYGNQLSGGIPLEIGSLANLIILDLYDNQLSGVLPDEIGNLTNLDILDIGNNSGVTGSLPGTMTNLTKLNEFYFDGTDLCVPHDGSFQAWFATLSYFESTSFPCYDCASQSSVPQAECEALVALYTSTNGDKWFDNSEWFFGHVTNWYGVSCTANHVVYINLTYNNLTGSIPAEIGDFPNLYTLYLGGSPISGSLPAELGNLNNLNDLWVYETNISGSIPISLGNLSQLEGLRLSSNQLNGSLPTEIGSMVNLDAFGVDNNNLSGTLPPELGNLTFLEFLDVRNNSFTGEIPGPFVNLINLLEFHNEDNALCMPNNNTALINWYQALDFGSFIYYCDPIIVTNTPSPTAPSSGGGGTSPTSTSLPTNTPTITFTPTITRTPTLVPPFQTLTQMALVDTQAAGAYNGLRTATPATSATLYYFYQQGTKTVEPWVLSSANGGSGLASEGDSSEGQSDIDVASTQSGMFIPPLAVWFAIIMAVVLIVGILIFDRRKRKKDPA